jgi:hypothetical protein
MDWIDPDLDHLSPVKGPKSRPKHKCERRGVRS